MKNYKKSLNTWIIPIILFCLLIVASCEKEKTEFGSEEENYSIEYENIDSSAFVDDTIIQGTIFRKIVVEFQPNYGGFMPEISYTNEYVPENSIITLVAPLEYTHYWLSGTTSGTWVFDYWYNWQTRKGNKSNKIQIHVGENNNYTLCYRRK